ncbi:MAG: hypothetical protein PHN51_10240 [Candidatus Nanopelagicales bacterium]|nr:hypothetical protein [Candidatus Nanopelagicales bacterium]
MDNSIKTFYLSVANYAGLKEDDKGNLVNINEKLGAFTLDDKPIALPHHEILKNPEGRNIFHPLNENYAVPINSQFNLFKSKLVFELNLKLSTIVLAMIRICSDPMLQQRVKTSKAVEFISSVGETDMTTIDKFAKLLKASQTANKEAFLFDIFLKKNGELKGEPYAAIGKLNVHILTELKKTLEAADGKYAVYGCTLRKKDVVSLLAIFTALFPLHDVPDEMTVGTDHNTFRMFNALLLSSFQVASRMNEVVDLLNEVQEPSLDLDTAVSDLAWSTQLEGMYKHTAAIRLIPDQTNVRLEGHQLKLNEPKSEPPAMVTPPTFQAASVPPPVAAAQQPQQLQAVPYPGAQQPQPVYPQVPQQLSPEETVRNMMAQRQMAAYGGMMPGVGYPSPGMVGRPMAPPTYFPQPVQMPPPATYMPPPAVYMPPPAVYGAPGYPQPYTPGAPF